METIYEILEEDLKIFLFAAWRNGSIGSETSLEEDEIAFNEWYENGSWMNLKKKE